MKLTKKGVDVVHAARAVLARSTTGGAAPPLEATQAVPAEHRERAAAGISPEAVRQRAYERWEAAGRPGGDGVDFWLQAEHELSQTH